VAAEAAPVVEEVEGRVQEHPVLERERAEHQALAPDQQEAAA